MSGLITPEPLVGQWGTPVSWPGPSGVAIIGVRRHAAADADVVLSALKSRTPTVVVGVPAADRALVDLLRAGAKEVLARDCSTTELLQAVQALRRDRPNGQHRTVNSPTDPTARELEVTELLAKGMTNRAIAGALFISEHTVRNHLGHVFAKLGVSSRTQAVVRAGQVGWLRLPL